MKNWATLADRELAAISLDACAQHIGWLLDRYGIENNRLTVQGWAIAERSPDRVQFLINGEPFDAVQYPIPSPDVGEFFWNIPSAGNARFICSTGPDSDRAFPDGFARLEFLTDSSDGERTRRRAWYLPDPRNDLALPSDVQIQRVISAPDPTNYLIGGAAIYKRLDHYLEEKFSKRFDDFPQILDFACGCGRVARHFRSSKGCHLTGVDTDRDNIAWCRRNLPHGQFLQTNLSPPLPFPDGSFDLVLAIAIFSNLPEKDQASWLRELKRVTAVDGLILVALPGLSQIGLARAHPSLLRQILEKGFVETGRSSDLDDIMPGQTHYVSGVHSRDYIESNWGRNFAILDFVDAIAANYDLVVMTNNGGTFQDFELTSVETRDLRPENPFALPLRDYDLNPFIHPTILKSGYRGHVVDMRGNDYVDLLSAWGTNLLGYGYRRVARAVTRQSRRFNSLGMPFPEFQDLKTLIRQLVPSAEEVRYGKNGSDACAGAVRLARFLTGREKILYRGYHGFHDWYFASTDCPGIPASLKSTVISQADITPASIEAAFRNNPGEIAALILNPLTGPIPTSDEISEVIEIIHSHGALVIFDEMMSGFRVAAGGMQELWNVTPDLSCFGKSIANGLPLSALCGKSEYIRRLPETYYGMTFEGEAVSIAAACATLTEVLEKDVVAALYEKGRQLRSAYARMADKFHLATSLIGYEPCTHIDFQTHGDVSGRELLWLFIQELVGNGILTCGAFILCYSHDRRDLRKIEAAVETGMAVVREAVDRGTTEGLLNQNTRERLDLINAPAKWRQTSA